MGCKGERGLRNEVAGGESTLISERKAGGEQQKGALANPCDKTLADIVSQPNHPVRSAPEERQRGEREQNTGENGSAGRKAKPQKQA